MPMHIAALAARSAKPGFFMIASGRLFEVELSGTTRLRPESGGPKCCNRFPTADPGSGNAWGDGAPTHVRNTVRKTVKASKEKQQLSPKPNFAPAAATFEIASKASRAPAPAGFHAPTTTC